MKFSAWTSGARLCTLLAVVLMSFYGCNCGKTGTGSGSKTGSGAITMPKKFNVPAGADPSVSAELGGNGFEKIAADSGWKTTSLTPEQFALSADTSAKKGGQLHWFEEDFPATFRPFGRDAHTTVISVVTGLVYETLMITDPLTQDLDALLASHWKIDPDGQTYYFRINPNARFSDGHPVTSEDVIATFNLMRDTAILDPGINTVYSKYDVPEALSKYVVKVHAKDKLWRNLLYFSQMQVLPAHYIKDLKGADFLKKFQYEMMPGSGPYAVRPEDVSNGKSVALTRLSDWWGASLPINKGQYNFDKVKMSIVADENLRYQKFLNNESDFFVVGRALWWATKFDFEDIKRGIIQKRKIYTDNPQGLVGFAFNMRRAPFDDPKVREAFSLLFNREQLLDKLMYNQYTMSDSYFPNSVYENKNNPKYRFNPDRATQLLAEAGYTSRNSDGILVKNGKPFVIELPALKSSEHILTPVQQALKQAGIQMNIRFVDWAQQIKLTGERNFDLVYLAYTGDPFPDMEGSFSSKLAKQPQSNNITGFQNARMDELIAKEQVSYDQKERTRLLMEMDSILMETRPYALAWYAPFQRVVYWNYLDQPKFYLAKTADYRDLIQRWWFDPEKKAIVDKARKDKSVKIEVGPTDIRFWPDYNTSHLSSGTGSTGDTPAAPAAPETVDTAKKPGMQ